MAKRLDIFIPFTKIDEENRLVYGRLTQEAPDKAKEIFDYESSVPFFKAWNEEFQARTDGESVGNVREMHQPSAVGKFTDMVYLDDEKAIDACCHVVDDAAWDKVVNKVYTGFSIGGGYVKKWKDGDLTRFTAKPTETSLVDNPCLGKATITQVIKAEGLDDPTLGDLRKSMYDVQDFAGLLERLGYLALWLTQEAEWEGDSSPIPAQLAAWMAQGKEIFLALAKEEVEELLALLPSLPSTEALAMAEKLAKGEMPEELAKKGARFSKAVKGELAEVHKLMKDCDARMAKLGYDVEETDDPEDADGKGEAEKLAKLDDERTEALKKVDELNAELKKVQDEADDLRKRVADLEKAPAPPKGPAKVVLGKSEDTGSPEEDDALRKEAERIAQLPPEERAVALMKVIHSTGGVPVR